jgi:hypothetical protein
VLGLGKDPLRPVASSGAGASFLYFFLQLQPGVEKGADVDVGFQEALANQ